MNKRAGYTEYTMEYTMLSDFAHDDIQQSMDVRQKHSGKGSFFERIEATADEVQPSYTIRDRQFCTPDSFLTQYAVSSPCSTSWITMIVNAGERALKIAGIDKALSPEFVRDCYSPKDALDPTKIDYCQGITMNEIYDGLKRKGLVSAEKAAEVIAAGGDLCSIKKGDRFFFNTMRPMGPNRGGLMNLVNEDMSEDVAEKIPVMALLSIDLLRLFFVKDMSTEPEDVMLSGTVYEPTFYALVMGYKKTTADVDGYWIIEGNVSPCEAVHLRLPMRKNETSSNYAGIAGYAFAITLQEDSVYETPSLKYPTMDSIPYFARRIVVRENGFDTATEVDFSRFTMLEELIFRKNSFPRVKALILNDMEHLRTVILEEGAFRFGDDLQMDNLPVLETFDMEGDNFNGSEGGRRLAEGDNGLHISSSSLKRLTIPKSSFKTATVVEISDTPLEQLTIMDGGLPNVKEVTISNVDTLQKVKIGKGALSSCEVLTLTDCNIDAENVDDVFELGEGALPNLKTIQVGNDPKSIALAESIAEKLGGDVEIVIVGEVPTTVVPSTEVPTQRPTEAPTTVPPTTLPPTEVPTTQRPTTQPPTEAPTTLSPTTRPSSSPVTLPPTPTPSFPPVTEQPTTTLPTEPPTLPFTPTPTPTIPVTTEPPTLPPPTTYDECWSTRPVSNNITSIVIDNNKCNEESVTVLDLSKYPKLKSVTIGDNSFMYTNEVIISGLNELESVVIGENSFTMMKDSFSNNSTRSFHLKNCPVLKELRIGNYTFSDYTVCEMESIPSVEAIEMGDYSFRYALFELGSESGARL